MVSLKYAFLLLLFFVCCRCSSQSTNPTVLNSQYEYFVYKYNKKTIKFTSWIDEFNLYNLIDTGFIIKKDELLITGDMPNCSFKEGVYLVKHNISTGVDTVNTVKWFKEPLLYSLEDSSIFLEKVRYSFVLHKCNEKSLDFDSVPKVRLLYPSESKTGQKIWTIVKLSFYQDTIKYISKGSDIKDLKGRSIVEEVAGNVRKGKKDKIVYLLKKISNYNGYECMQQNYYPILLEYFDGKVTRTYILASKKCIYEKELYNLYCDLIGLLLSF